MLFKLMRYDFKRLLRSILPIGALMLLSAGLFDLIYWRIVRPTQVEQYLSAVYVILAFVLAAAVYIGFVLLPVPVGTHLYDDLKSEGYRSFVPPAGRGQFLASKVITGCVCALLGTAVSMASLFIIFFSLTGAFEAEEAAEAAETANVVRETAGSSDSSILIPILIVSLILVQLIRFVIQAYFSTALGYTAAKIHKAAASVGFYLLISTAIILATVLIASLSAALIGGQRAIVFTVSTLTAVHGIICVAFYLGLLRLLKTKLNLQ